MLLDHIISSPFIVSESSLFSKFPYH